MRYAELSRHVWMLWCEARHLHPIDPPYRAWIVERTIERALEAALHHDHAVDELGLHLLADYSPRLDLVERNRFVFWWAHVMDHGFNADSPLAHLHKPQRRKVGAK